MAVFESPFYTHRPAKSRWASALEAISKGLASVAEMRQRREEEDSKQTHEDARDAARNAFAENLARFTQGKEDERQAASLGAQEKYHTAEISERKAEHESEDTRRAQEHADSMSIEKARLSLEGRRVSAEEARANKADKDAAEKSQRDDENARKNRASEAQKAASATLSSQMKERSELFEAVNKPGAQSLLGPQEFAAAKEQLKQLDHDIANTRKDIATLSTAAGFETAGGKETTAAEAAKLAPDRQQLFKDLQSQFPGKSSTELLQRVKDTPQEAVDQAMSLRPGAKSGASTDTTGAGDFMPQTDKGAANVAQAGSQSDVLNASEPQGADQHTLQTLNSGSAQLADSGAAQSAATPSDQPAMAPGDQSVAANTDVPESGAAVPETTGDQEAQDQQFQQFRQQLDQSPEGQGVHTTLDRLAQSDNQVQADKLRRQAELQLGDLGDENVDPSSYIDWYLQQQQQEPGYA